MTDQAANDQAVVERAHELEKKVLGHVTEIRSSWTDMAGDLFTFHQDRCWEVLGVPTFEEWLGQPECDLGRRQAFSLIEVWRELVIERKVHPDALKRAAITKIRGVLPAIKAGDVTVEEALADCEVLSRSDLLEKYSGDPQATIDAEAEPNRHACPECGHRHKVKEPVGGGVE